MRILALDLATHMGWAAGSLTKVEASGSRTLPKTDDRIGEFLCAYRGWLVSFCQQRQFTNIVFEAPILGDNTSIIAKRKLFGLANVTEMIAHDLGIDCVETYQQSWRLHFVGVVRAPIDIEGQNERRKWIKLRVMNECRKRGWKPVDDNEADALGILDYFRARKDPLHAMQASELFRSASDAA